MASAERCKDNVIELAETVGSYDKLVEAGRALIALGPDALDSVEVIDNRRMREAGEAEAVVRAARLAQQRVMAGDAAGAREALNGLEQHHGDLSGLSVRLDVASKALLVVEFAGSR